MCTEDKKKAAPNSLQDGLSDMVSQFSVVQLLVALLCGGRKSRLWLAASSSSSARDRFERK
jgi:hypothetical protein